MRANPVALIVLLAAPVAAEPVRIDISTESVIGLSGIEVSADGTGFLAISDRGWFVEGTPKPGAVPPCPRIRVRPGGGTEREDPVDRKRSRAKTCKYSGGV